MVVLGIELDLVAQIARLPTDKLEVACQIVQQWCSRRLCNRGQLESLIGHLQHTAKVVWPGRIFLHRMIDLLCCFRRRDHPIRLNHEFCLDMEWWHTFLSSWNGVSFWLFPGMSPPADVEVISDASGSLGFGALTSMVNGSAVPGCTHSSLSPSLKRNCSQLFLQPEFGELSGLDTTSCFVAIMRQWCTSLILGLPRSPP